METPIRFFDYWYFSLPNYLLAALMYSLLARFALSLFLDSGSRNYIFRFFVRITDPVLAVFGFVTPRAVAPLLLILLSVVWILLLRFVFYLAMAGAGLAPPVTGS